MVTGSFYSTFMYHNSTLGHDSTMRQYFELFYQVIFMYSLTYLMEILFYGKLFYPIIYGDL